MQAWHRQAPRLVGPLVAWLALAGLDHWSAGPAAFSGVLLGTALMAGLALTVAWAARRRAVQAPGWEALAQATQAAVRAALEMALGVVLVFALAAPLTLLLPTPWMAGLVREDRAADLLAMLLIGVGTVVATRAWRTADRQSGQALQAQRDAAHARADLADRDRQLVLAELQVLRSQVEPHFLWNTLAHVEYLIRKDPVRAQAMMEHLIGYLRRSVPEGRRASITLGEEFASVQAYLGLMQLRMGARLEVELQLPTDLAGCLVPPMMLQTLVENAIKHGLEPLPGQARLCVRALAPSGAPGRLRAEVLDNGVGLQPRPHTRGTGLGLRHVRERLRALYGTSAVLEITSRETGGLCAAIEWPARQADALDPAT